MALITSMMNLTAQEYTKILEGLSAQIETDLHGPLRQWREVVFDYNPISFDSIWSKKTSFPRLAHEMSVVAKYDDERFPAATIEVVVVIMDKYDPLNPNPKAGGIKRYEVFCGDRKIGRPFTSLPAAKLKAKAVHQTMVTALLDQERAVEEERRRRNPNYGRFG